MSSKEENIPAIALLARKIAKEAEEKEKQVTVPSETNELKRYQQALEDIRQKATKVRDEYMQEKSKEGKYFDAMVYGFGGLTEILDIIYNVKEK